MAFLADGELAEQALNRASPLDREHKRLGSSHVGEAAATTSSACRPAPFKRRRDLQQERFL